MAPCVPVPGMACRCDWVSSMAQYCAFAVDDLESFWFSAHVGRALAAIVLIPGSAASALGWLQPPLLRAGPAGMKARQR